MGELYAVRKGSVRSTQKYLYAPLKTSTKLLQFQETNNTTNMAFEVKTHFSSARIKRAIFGHFKLTIVKHGLLAIENPKK